MAPLVVACLRITDLRPRVDPLSGSVSRDHLGIGWPAADAAALEHALRAAEAWGGRVLAVSVGPPSVEPALIEARALGASVVRIADDEADDRSYADELAADEHELARLIAAALVPIGPPALVVCGDRSADRGTGALPAFLAHELGAAQALGLVRLEPERGYRSGRCWPSAVWTAVGVSGSGYLCPAVCSVEPAGVAPAPRIAGRGPGVGGSTRPRCALRVPARARPWIAASMSVGARPFRPRTRVVPPPDGQDPRTRMLALTGVLETHDPPTVVGPVDAAAAADALRRLPGAPRLSRHRRQPPRSSVPPHPVVQRRGRAMSRLDRSAWPEVAARPGPGTSSSSRSARPSSTAPTCRSRPTPTSPRRCRPAPPVATTRLVVAPALAYGSSGEHEGFAGTLSIGRDATELVLRRARTVGQPGLRHSIVVSTHGGNTVPIGRALARLRQEGHLSTVLVARVGRRPPRRPHRDLPDAGHRPRTGASRPGRGGRPPARHLGLARAARPVGSGR